MGGACPPPLTAAWCRTGVDIEPRQLSGRDWQGRAGGEAAERLLREARQSGTAKKYARVLQKWMKFNEEGYMGQPYDPMVFTIAKWWLVAGWMMNPAENNDKDLNVVRWQSCMTICRPRRRCRCGLTNVSGVGVR